MSEEKQLTEEQKALQVLEEVNKKKEAFFKAYVELCKEHGYQIVAKPGLDIGTFVEQK